MKKTANIFFVIAIAAFIVGSLDFHKKEQIPEPLYGIDDLPVLGGLPSGLLLYTNTTPGWSDFGPEIDNRSYDEIGLSIQAYTDCSIRILGLWESNGDDSYIIESISGFGTFGLNRLNISAPFIKLQARSDTAQRVIISILTDTEQK